MKKLMFFLLTICLVSLFFQNETSAVVIGGYTFGDNAFPDSATYVSGEVSFRGFTPTGDLSTDLNTALTGHDLSTGISGQSDGDLGYTVELNFLDNYLFNGDGPDLVVFEFGTVEPFDVAIYNPVLDEWTTYLRVTPVDIGSINVGEIDFSVWGITSTAQINKVRISTEHWNNSWVGADINALGGLNSASAPALVGYWKFDEANGSEVLDSSVFGNNGTIYEATRTLGECGKALYFDEDTGADTDYVVVPNSPSIDTSEFTVSCWVSLANITKNNVILDKRNDQHDRNFPVLN